VVREFGSNLGNRFDIVSLDLSKETYQELPLPNYDFCVCGHTVSNLGAV
jgi:hypothetical protein